MLLTRLLEQHYGLTLNDTPFSDETVIQEHIDAGITLADAVNFLVENTNWFVSIAEGLAGRNNPLSSGCRYSASTAGNWLVAAKP
jgi:hypothetical protein